MLKHISRRLSRGQDGFTLIELLVVVAIIALLATFAAPKLFEAINKSKKAPGQADMSTISSALERYYMDNGRYPTGTVQQVKDALTAGYIKSSTTFRNGYKQGYIYVTSTNGAGYFLLDLQGKSPTTITVTCTDSSVTPATTTAVTPAEAKGDSATLVVNNTITDAQINSCALTLAGASVADTRYITH